MSGKLLRGIIFSNRDRTLSDWLQDRHRQPPALLDVWGLLSDDIRASL
jgi:hypothetical protein